METHTLKNSHIVWVHTTLDSCTHTHADTLKPITSAGVHQGARCKRKASETSQTCLSVRASVYLSGCNSHVYVWGYRENKHQGRSGWSLSKG